MMAINKKRIITLISISFAGILLLTGCSTILSQMANRATEEPEIIPTPVALPAILSDQQQVEELACLVAEKPSIHSDEDQGSLLAWQPNNTLLALIQPVNQSFAWYVGDLFIFDAKTGEDRYFSENTAVFGDLTWAPDGNALAYILLDQQQGIYSIRTLSLADRTETDVFGDIDSARTDDFSSLKGITSWDSNIDLVVTSSCGTDCVQVYGFNPVSLALNVREEIRQNENSNLLFENEYTSPDGKWLITIDEKDNTWLTSTTEQQITLLLPATEVFEVKWSDDSAYFALRLEDLVKVYQAGC